MSEEVGSRYVKFMGGGYEEELGCKKIGCMGICGRARVWQDWSLTGLCTKWGRDRREELGIAGGVERGWRGPAELFLEYWYGIGPATKRKRWKAWLCYYRQHHYPLRACLLPHSLVSSSDRPILRRSILPRAGSLRPSSAPSAVLPAGLFGCGRTWRNCNSTSEIALKA